jgi:hypothetical protein
MDGNDDKQGKLSWFKSGKGMVRQKSIMGFLDSGILCMCCLCQVKRFHYIVINIDCCRLMMMLRKQTYIMKMLSNFSQ